VTRRALEAAAAEPPPPGEKTGRLRRPLGWGVEIETALSG
jgi:hypothetical protein